jgi:uncharacterized peroxidase-related enzyme
MRRMTPPKATASSWTPLIAPESASSAVQPMYEQIRTRSSRGEVSRFWQVCAPDPPALEALFAHARTLMDAPAPLTPAQAELIATVVSATNGCGYCVAHHGPRLAKALGDEALARAVALDYREANLTARDRVLLDYAVALTCEPSERTLADIQRVREYGFDDAAVLKATEITAYFNQVNRIASGLGVALEPGVATWEFGEQR